MRCVFGFMLQSLNGMHSAQVVLSTLSKPCTLILTERPHLLYLEWWNVHSFSYLETGGPCAGFCGFFFFLDVLLCIYPFSMLPICVPCCFLFSFVCWLVFHLTHLPSLLCLLMFFHLHTSTLICAEAVSTMVWRNERGGLAWSELQTGA